ncbi:MAG: DUF2200 domain-containing protein [Chthonomonas sp.]|nr:DUF2200 domain-containing protein [Chthonomonas sp.]
MQSTDRVRKIVLASVYPHYLTKAAKKDRTPAEVDEVICWLTGYSNQELHQHLDAKSDLATFFDQAPSLNSARSQITGTICGVKIQEIEDPFMREIRYMDKLIDELGKGRPMDKILRQLPE